MNKLYTGKNPVVIVGNGEFPAHPIPLNHLKNSGTIICADSGADQIISHNFTPDAIIGDMDSTKFKKEDFKGLWIHLRTKTEPICKKPWIGALPMM